MYLSDKLEVALKDILKNGRDWDRKPTTVPGVFILRLPKYKIIPPRLVVELNPIDEYGKPSKRRGLILRSSEDLREYRELINTEKLDNLLKTLDKVNSSTAEKGGVEGVLEI